MLPHALKVVWFCLSLTGIIVCWVVLCAFSRAISSYWGPMLYCVFATLLQGIFCLGMIYDMDPFQMPRAFCIFQTFGIYYSAWSLTGVCAAFTFATSGSVLWPPATKTPGNMTLGWKNLYYFPIFVFPLACLSVSLPVLLRVNAIQPTEDLHCDANQPEWGRFLGYAGLSMILSIPCLLLSAIAARRVYRMHCNIRSRYSSSFTGLVHLYWRSQASDEQKDLPEGVKSRTPPTSNIPDYETLNSAQPQGTRDALLYDDVPDASPPAFDALSTSQKRSEPWEALDLTEKGNMLDPRKQTKSATTRSAPPSRPNLAPAIWRLILFQMVFFTIECLAALSTVIDIAQHRPTPTPFGSQHVALVLVGWGPAVVFGHLPVVRRQLLFWKKELI